MYTWNLFKFLIGFPAKTYIYICIYRQTEKASKRWRDVGDRVTFCAASSSARRRIFHHYKPPCTPHPSTWYGLLEGGWAAGLLFSDFSGVAAAVVLATSASMSATSSSTSAAEHASRPHSSDATWTAAVGSIPRTADSVQDAAITDGFFVKNSGSEEKKKRTKWLVKSFKYKVECIWIGDGSVVYE